MSAPSRRTDTVFFITVLAILAGGLVWARSSWRSTAPATNASSPATEPAVTTQSGTTSAAWSGELVLVRGDEIIGRAASGTERTIYRAPHGRTIVNATNIVGEHVLVGLGGGDGLDPLVVDLNLKDGQAVGRSDLPNVQLTALRPTTSGYARATFSNDERHFGSAVTLVESGKDRSIYEPKGETVTSLAWRADGDALALGTQTGVIVVPLTAGDAATFDLATPVRSLTWQGGSVLAVTEKDEAVEINPASNPVIASRSVGFGDVGRDFYQVAPDRYVWLRTTSGSGAVVATTEDATHYRANDAEPVDITTASRILGLFTP